MMTKYAEMFPHQQLVMESNPEKHKIIENRVNDQTIYIWEFSRGSINPPNKMIDINNSINPSVNVTFVIGFFLIALVVTLSNADPFWFDGRLKKVN